MIDPRDLTAAERDALRKIGMWRLKRRRGGYGLGGEPWRITNAMVARLRHKSLVSEIAGARVPLVLTGEGRNTLAVMDERARSKADG
ncbi:hypothetical protein [Oricola sp.]|uniref:hypothetical protein n=1 Tax=Oricola sp. TaxID=1979950 RepID=UPI0025EABBEB|nr:hypothetical protein [Oricola sp.]MCI5075672.1 hypothetical protein [Oricola sp.]